METKSKSVFHSQQLQLAIKAVIFGGFLTLAKVGNLGLLPVLFFLFVACFLYLKPLFNPQGQLSVFVLLLAVSILFSELLNDFNFFIIAAAFSSFIFYLIIGIKDLILIKREVWSYFTRLSLILAIAFLFFNSAAFSGLPLKSAALFVGYYLVFRGIFVRSEFSLAASIILLEFSLMARFLPFNSLNAASLVLLGYFLLTDLIKNYLDQTINRRIILVDLTIFLILSLLIFASTRWSLAL